MRNLLTISTGLFLLATTAACETGPGAVKEPPVLNVTSPARSLLQDHAGPVMVSGTVTANANGDSVAQVLVNGVQATVGADGTFAAMITVPEGATLIQTVASDAAGTSITDTRAVQAGQLRPVGANLPGAISIALSSDAFTKISAAAGPILKGLDLGALIAPLQPMVSAGTSCNGIHLSVDDVKLTDVKISLSPVDGGLAFSAELDGLDVPAHADYGLICVNATTSLRVQASKVTVAGTLDVTPNGMSGFTTKLSDPKVAITGLDVSASGLPGTILNLLDFNSVIGLVAGKAAELAMNPLMNQALGALAGPQMLTVLGKQLSMQMAPSAIAFEAGGASLTMSLNVLIGGSEKSPGFIFTNNGAPAVNPTLGFQLGIADDLANEMLAELQQIGMLNLKVPAEGGTFEEAQIQMNLPPMISADATSGQMRLVLGDMYATFLHNGAAVGKAAINAKVDLKIAPVSNGYGVALQLGVPEIHVDPLSDVANTTGLDSDSLGRAVAACLGSQIDAITKLLVAIPLPQIDGLQVRNLSIGSDSGYVMISGKFD